MVDQVSEIRPVRKLQAVYAMDGVKVTHIILDPGQEVPWHHHTRVRDTFYAARGPVTVQLRDPEGEAVLDDGEVHQAEVGQPHRVVNLSDHRVEFLLIQGVGQYDFVLEKDGGQPAEA